MLLSLKSQHSGWLSITIHQSNARGQHNHQAINPTHETDQALRHTAQWDPQHIETHNIWTQNTLKPTTQGPTAHWHPQNIETVLSKGPTSCLKIIQGLLNVTSWIILLFKVAHSEEGFVHWTMSSAVQMKQVASVRFEIEEGLRAV